MKDKPKIGITLDHEPGGGYSAFPWYALRQNYCDAVREVGGLALPLAHEVDLVSELLDLIDGLIVTGGAFDVDPAYYGGGEKHATTSTKDRRTAFEWAITKGALERDLPVLGICGGQQLQNVVLGGTLVQHIPDGIDDPLAHEQPNPRDQPGHEVRIAEGTLLHRLTGRSSLSVNSAHHQAAARIGPGVVVAARASDGVVEAIEHPAYRFCLGVQWHPEFFVDPADRLIMAAFVEAAREPVPSPASRP